MLDAVLGTAYGVGQPPLPLVPDTRAGAGPDLEPAVAHDGAGAARRGAWRGGGEDHPAGGHPAVRGDPRAGYGAPPLSPRRRRVRRRGVPRARPSSPGTALLQGSPTRPRYPGRRSPGVRGAGTGSGPNSSSEQGRWAHPAVKAVAGSRPPPLGGSTSLPSGPALLSVEPLANAREHAAAAHPTAHPSHRSAVTSGTKQTSHLTTDFRNALSVWQSCAHRGTTSP